MDSEAGQNPRFIAAFLITTFCVSPVTFIVLFRDWWKRKCQLVWQNMTKADVGSSDWDERGVSIGQESLDRATVQYPINHPGLGDFAMSDFLDPVNAS